FEGVKPLEQIERTAHARCGRLGLRCQPVRGATGVADVASGVEACPIIGRRQGPGGRLQWLIGRMRKMAQTRKPNDQRFSRPKAPPLKTPPSMPKPAQAAPNTLNFHRR